VDGFGGGLPVTLMRASGRRMRSVNNDRRDIYHASRAGGLSGSSGAMSTGRALDGSNFRSLRSGGGWFLRGFSCRF